MKKIDLDSELKALSVPERGQEFWDALPQRVLAQARADTANPGVRTRSMLWRAWDIDVAMACLVAGLCLALSQMPKTACYALLKNGEELRHTAWRFPDQLRALMQDEHGLHKLIEDQP